MRQLRNASIFLFAAAGLGASVLAHEGEELVAAPVELTAEEQAVIDTLDAYSRAVAAADLDAVEAVVVTDESFSYGEGAHLDVGWQSFAKHMEPEFAAFGDATYTFTDVHPFVSGDMAYAHLHYDMNVVVLSDQFEGGKHPVSMKGLGTVVLVKDDGDWKIRHMHMVRDTSKPAEPAAE
jgi:ketosteroid isomerase-like protein